MSRLQFDILLIWIDIRAQAVINELEFYLDDGDGDTYRGNEPPRWGQRNEK